MDTVDAAVEAPRDLLSLPLRELRRTLRCRVALDDDEDDEGFGEADAAREADIFGGRFKRSSARDRVRTSKCTNEERFAAVNCGQIAKQNTVYHSLER